MRERILYAVIADPWRGYVGPMRYLTPFLLPLLLSGCWSAGVDAVAWEPPVAASLQPDPALERATLLDVGPMPEDVAVDPADREGAVYAGLDDGRIVRALERHQGEPQVTTFATVPGVPLGLKFGPDRTLYACVSGHGLVAISQDGAVRDLATSVEGRPLGFANDLDVAADGTIYFTESSSRFTVKGAGPIRAIAENRPDGRVLAYDPATGATRVVATGLHFPNGVTVTHGGRALMVAETARYRLSRVWLSGPETGKVEALPHPLPGIPDGIMNDGKGTVWAALVPRDAFLDGLAPHPWARNAMGYMPDGLLMGLASGTSTGIVAALDEDGRVQRTLVDATGRMKGGIANVAPVGGSLYLGTKWGSWVGTLAL